jgi:hypothetical protein
VRDGREAVQHVELRQRQRASLQARQVVAELLQ